MPATFLCDSVHIVYDESRNVLASVIVEVQRDRDPDKRFSWPVYVAALRAKMRAPVYLVVLSPDPAIAAWAREPIELGPGSRITPIAISLAEIPRITEVPIRERTAELAVLSTLAHPEIEIGLAALEAIADLPGDVELLYLSVLRDAVPELKEATMDITKFRTEYGREHQAIGHAKGRAEAMLTLARAKLGDLTPELAAKLRDYGDLDALIVALGMAPDAAAAWQVLVELGITASDQLDCSGATISIVPKIRIREPSARSLIL